MAILAALIALAGMLLATASASADTPVDPALDAAATVAQPATEKLPQSDAVAGVARTTGTAAKRVTEPVEAVTAPVAGRVEAVTAPATRTVASAAGPVADRVDPVARSAGRADAQDAAQSAPTARIASARRSGSDGNAAKRRERRAGRDAAGPRSEPASSRLAPLSDTATPAPAISQVRADAGATSGAADDSPLSPGGDFAPALGGAAPAGSGFAGSLFVAGLLTALLLLGAPGAGGRLRTAVAGRPLPEFAFSVERPG